MFDVPDGTATEMYIREFDRKMRAVERSFVPAVRNNYDKQFRLAADIVEQGMIRDTDMAVDEMSGNLSEIFFTNYKKIGILFSRWVFDEAEKEKIITRSVKGPKEEFWREFDEFVTFHVAEQIKIVSDSQKILIRNIVDKSMREGMSHKEIASQIKKQGYVVKKWKALRIARTETHTVANKAMHKSADSLGRRGMRKQWSHSMDERVRSKNFNHRIDEIVPMNESFEGTGELLDFPGDPSGSAGNIVNCRCVEKYITR